ncbi:MAG: cupin domain-containing protein [Parvibaculaceae bacterium]
MDLQSLPGVKADFERRGHAGPFRFLTGAECLLLQRYVRSGELTAPAVWGKGLAVRDPLIYGIATKPELLAVLAQLLGRHVYLWGAQVIAKEPGEAHPWHTDIETSAPRGRFVSVWIGLENTSAKSALQHIGGSHRIGKPLQQVAHEKQVDRPRRTGALALAWARETIADAALEAVDVRDGDAVLFDGRIWHGSLNSEDRPRRALLLQYAAAHHQVRIPDLGKTMNWPFAYTAELPPAITVLGRTRGYRNLVEPPRDKALASPMIAALAAAGDGGPWTPHPLMAGRTAAAGKFSAHFSLLQPGHSPHPPHAHVEEEILIVIDGEAEVVLPAHQDDPAPAIHRLKAGDFTYYPPYRWHTIRNAGAKPIVYLMYKWRGAPLGLTEHAPAGVFIDGDRPARPDKAYQTELVFQGGTHFLEKLHAHRSVLLPGGGYEPHADPYDVMIALLSGTVETLGTVVTAPAFLYHPAGSLHGIRGIGHSPARYLVIEMHGAAARDARGRARSRPNLSMADEFVIMPDRRWSVWRVT